MSQSKKSFFSLGFEKDDAVKTGRFLLYFIVVYLLLSIAVKALFPIPVIEAWVAGNVLAMLQAFGHEGVLSFGETALIELGSGTSIEISELCTGLMETLIIAGAIIASVGIGWKKRALGAAIAVALVVAFNHLRIVVTTLIILGSGDLALIEFAHNILFRIFLFIAIAGIYIAWFYWAAVSEMKGKK